MDSARRKLSKYQKRNFDPIQNHVFNCRYNFLYINCLFCLYIKAILQAFNWNGVRKRVWIKLSFLSDDSFAFNSVVYKIREHFYRE